VKRRAVTFIWEEKICYVYMGTGKLLPLYGNRKFVTFIWEEEICYVYMVRGKLLRLYGKRKVVAFIWEEEGCYVYMGRGILKELMNCNNLPFPNSSFTAELMNQTKVSDISDKTDFLAVNWKAVS
jgi:hypothetical protein